MLRVTDDEEENVLQSILSVSPWSILLTRFGQFLYTFHDSLHYGAVFSSSTSKAGTGIGSLIPTSIEIQSELPAHQPSTASWSSSSHLLSPEMTFSSLLLQSCSNPPTTSASWEFMITIPRMLLTIYLYILVLVYMVVKCVLIFQYVLKTMYFLLA